MQTAHDAALDYTARGWAPVPVPHQAKGPNLEGWQRLRIGAADVPRYFNGAPQNIGLLLGQPSGGLADVDCDCPEAVAAAPFFLPETQRRHGRKSNPASHHWFTITDKPAFRSEKIVDPMRQGTDGKKCTLVELRGTGGQTIVAPSIHPSGEPIEWEAAGEPARVTFGELRAAYAKIGACALVAWRWPQGARHEASLALSGCLLAGGMAQHDAERFLEAVVRVAGDSEWRDRMRAVADTARAIANGNAATGGRRLAELLRDGPAVVRELNRLLGLKHATAQDVRARADVSAALCTLDTVEMIDPKPLWKPYIWLEAITLLAGDFGEGKSWVALAIAAHGSRGWQLPGPDGDPGTESVEPWRTLYLTVENDPSTVRLRLERIGGDPRQVVVWDTTKAPLPNITNVAALEAALVSVKPRLVVVDPLQSILGGRLNIDKANEVRAVLDPLAALARKYECAVLPIMHLNKATSLQAKHRIMASVDFGAAARSILIVAPDPANRARRVMTHEKCNLSRKGKSQTFVIEGDERNVTFTWAGSCDLTADDLFATNRQSENMDTKVDGAVTFLREALKDGPKPKQLLEEWATDRGIDAHNLGRAASRLKVRYSNEGFPRRTTWRLP